MFRQNFRARLIIGAVLWVSTGLCVSWFVLAAIFRGVIISQFDHDLVDHAEELAALVEIDAHRTPIVRRAISDSRFVPARSGLYWQVDLANGATVRSPSLQGALYLPTGPDTDDDKSASVDGPTGPMRLIRKLIHPFGLKEPVEIRIGADERLIDKEMARVHVPLAASLGIIAIGLIGAAYAQVTYGLQPLARIRRAVVAVRSGKTRQLPDDLPTEVLPLVRELNGMIAANLNMVEQARVLAGNFAHALKMPLAILAEEAKGLERRGHRAAAKIIVEQCSRMNLLIDYQTARARASALTNVGACSRPNEIIRDVINAYSRLNAGRKTTFVFERAADVVVACDPIDLTEMIGNLVDNAAKWARERVVVTVRNLGSAAEILVEDDGPGIPAEHRESVFGIGIRLDEAMPGTGLGLAITRDLATLYGGEVRVDRSRYDGAAVYLVLKLLVSPPDLEETQA